MKDWIEKARRSADWLRCKRKASARPPPRSIRLTASERDRDARCLPEPGVRLYLLPVQTALARTLCGNVFWLRNGAAFRDWPNARRANVFETKPGRSAKHCNSHNRLLRTARTKRTVAAQADWKLSGGLFSMRAIKTNEPMISKSGRQP